MKHLRITFAILLLTAVHSKADLDASKLPPASTAKVNFEEDVRPIFEQSCLRCHNTERPKSHFSLATRERALNGGNENSDDIVPGESAKSRLIHYVAGLVPDMEMPPVDKGDALTPQQISVLRAWIDQGAAWGESAPQTLFSLTPSLRWMDTSGSRGKFREVEGTKEGWGGGAGQFSFSRQISADEKFSAEGHALEPDNDFRVQLTLAKNDFGFTRGDFEIWRRYYDDRGGFAPNLPLNSFTLGRDLHLDTGRAWIDFGLTLPDWPKIILGYEYQFRQGEQSTLQWGTVGDPNVAGKNIFPAFKRIDENVHIIKLDVSHDLFGWQLEDTSRLEFYHLQTSRQNVLADAVGSSPDSFANVAERDNHTQGMNTFSVHKQLRDWLAVSGGYFYSRLEGDAGLQQNTVDAAGDFVSGYQLSADRITLHRESHITSAGFLAGPWAALTLSGGIQAEWTRQESLGFEKLLSGLPDNPDPQYSSTNQAIGRLDSASVRENFSLRYTMIPYTVLFAETRLQQESLGRFDAGQLVTDFGTGPFTRRTEADLESEEYRVGFNTSPWQRLSFGGTFTHGERNVDYSNATANWLGVPNYPGFFNWRDTEDNQVQARLVWRAASWLRTSFNYQLRRTDFHNDTPPIVGILPGGTIESGRERASVYSINAVLTPFRRLYFSSTFSYNDSRVNTAQNGADYLTPYEGKTYSSLSSATFALNSKTDLKLNYIWSHADFTQHNQLTGLPAGIDYERNEVQAGVNRRLNKNILTSLTYGYSQYREPTAGGASDFSAHTLFATLTMRLP